MGVMTDELSRPHVPSWDDHDKKKRETEERRRAMGISEGETPFQESVDPLSDDWLDVVVAPDVDPEDTTPKSIGEMMERLGSLPHFKVTFDAGKLNAINLEKFAYHGRNISGEKSTENLQRMVEVFSRLPELEFNHGQSYFIYGPNGSGKSVLTQAIMVAVQRKRYELEKMTKKYQDEVASGRSFRSGEFMPSFPRTAQNNVSNEIDTAENNLIVAISECIDIGDLVTAESSEKEAGSELQTARGVHLSLGASASTAMELSGAQATNTFVIDQVSRYRGPREAEPTMVFLDEPETSRDRYQLKNLRAEVDNIRSRYGKETIALVPTHSEYIFNDPTAPRIDLDHPEKGVHFPEVIDPIDAIDLSALTPEQLLRLAEIATSKARAIQAE